MPVNTFAAIASILCLAFLSASKGQETPLKYYNIKAGPVYVTLSAGMSTVFIDNVNTSNGTTTPIESDIIVNPHFNINSLSQFAFFSPNQINTLSLNMNVGYQKYLMHSELNHNPLSINISPDSELTLLIRTGHFKIRITDGFALQQDPVADGSLSNVAQFRHFTNTFGIATEWDVNSKTVINVGYSHTNLAALSLLSLSGSSSTLNINSLSNSSDQVNASISAKVFSLLSLGFAGSAGTTTYPSAPWQNSNTYSCGPTLDARFTEYTTLSAACGVNRNMRSGQTSGTNSLNNNLSDSTSDYFNVSIKNNTNTYYTQTFSFGIQSHLGLLGNQTQTTYVRYTSAWRMNSRITIASTCYVESTNDLSSQNSLSTLGTQSTLSSPSSSSHYRVEGLQIGTQYELSKKLNTGLSYRFTNKTADNSAQNYKQNCITWEVSYRF